MFKFVVFKINLNYNILESYNMIKKLTTILILFFVIGLSGCCSIHEKVITGVEKVKIAVEKMKPHNVELIEVRIVELRAKLDSAITEEDKTFWKSKLENEILFLQATHKLPLALEELLKTLKGE